MKLKNTTKSKGMTLLELTVVILVLLSLISILFIGARAWKKGSDRAGCILNIRNVQQATRGYMNMNPGTTSVASSVIYDTTGNLYLKTPVCPAAGIYTFDAATTTAGTVFLKCGLATSDNHVPASTTDW